MTTSVILRCSIERQLTGPDMVIDVRQWREKIKKELLNANILIKS